MLKLDDRSWGLTGHVVNSVLVTEPVGTLDGIVHMPPPIILVHVTQSGIDTTLGSHGMASRREKL